MQIPVQPPLATLVITALLLMLVVPIFATGELSPEESRGIGKYLASGWKPKNLRLGKMASGLPYLLLLTLFCLGLFALSFVGMGKAGDIGRSGLIAQSGASSSWTQTAVAGQTTVPMHATTTTQVTTTINGKTVVTTTTSQAQPVPAPPAPPAIPHQEGNFREAAIVLLASVAGFALLCQFLSVACRNRWVAWLFAMLFFGVISLVPLVSRASASQYSPPGFSINLFYFNPMIAICQMSDNYNYAEFLMFEHSHPVWLVTSVLWLIVGAFSLLFTFALVARQRKTVASG